jgi:hypothetical protein
VKLIKFFEYFEKPENKTKIKIGVFSCLAVLIALDFLLLKKPHFPWEGVPGFYSLYGFVACVMIVVVSKAIGKLWLQKKEDYYD